MPSCKTRTYADRFIAATVKRDDEAQKNFQAAFDKQMRTLDEILHRHGCNVECVSPPRARDITRARRGDDPQELSLAKVSRQRTSTHPRCDGKQRHAVKPSTADGGNSSRTKLAKAPLHSPSTHVVRPSSSCPRDNPTATQIRTSPNSSPATSRVLPLAGVSRRCTASEGGVSLRLPHYEQPAPAAVNRNDPQQSGSKSARHDSTHPQTSAMMSTQRQLVFATPRVVDATPRWLSDTTHDAPPVDRVQRDSESAAGALRSKSPPHLDETYQLQREILILSAQKAMIEDELRIMQLVASGHT